MFQCPWRIFTHKYGPQHWPRRVARAPTIQISSDKRPKGSQVKSLKDQVSRVSEFSTIFSQNIDREVSNINSQIYSAPYLPEIFESVTLIHTIYEEYTVDQFCHVHIFT